MSILPSGWQEVRLGDIAKIIKVRNKENKNYPVLSNSAIYGVVLQEEYFYKKIASKNDTTNYYIADIGNFIYNPRISENAPAGPINVNKLTKGIVSPLYTVFDVKKEYINFIAFYLSSSLWVNYLKEIANYGARYDRLGINDKMLLSIPILLPPLDEQKRIADILSTFDDLIENLTKLIEKKELYKKGIMQRVLSGEVRFNGFTDEWETVRLGDIATITSAGVDKKINDNETKVRLLNYLDVFNRNKLYDNEISFITSANENQIKKCDIKKGDLFITPSSEDREGIAKSAVAMEDFTNVVYSYHIIRLRFDREIDLKFKSYMCDTALFHRQAYRLCDGSGQRYVISLGTFREMEIYIPKSVEEQKKIGELLSLIDQDIDNLKRLLHLRKLQKKGVMQKLLTGEVRV